MVYAFEYTAKSRPLTELGFRITRSMGHLQYGRQGWLIPGDNLHIFIPQGTAGVYFIAILAVELDQLRNIWKIPIDVLHMNETFHLLPMKAFRKQSILHE